jgi:hypothetical protein
LNTNHIKNIFFQPIFKESISIEALGQNDQDYIQKISEDYLFAGALLASINFSPENTKIKEKLTRFSKKHLMKYMLMKKDLIDVNHALNLKGVTPILLKGMALNMANISQPSERFCRDIDLLVDKREVKTAYTELRKLKFRYVNEDCLDDCRFLDPMHHIPPMINANGTVIELHHRITSPEIYKNCPLTYMFINNSKKIGQFEIPPPEGLIMHAMYHGIQHNFLRDGPMFLIDIKNIINKYKLKINFNDIANILTISNEVLHKVNNILSIPPSKNINNGETLKRINDLFNLEDVFLPEKQKSISSRRSTINKLIKIRYDYQADYFSLKYLNILLNKLKTKK